MSIESQSNKSSVPTNINEIQADLTLTLLKVWEDFVEHIPFLVAGLLVLFLTWLVAAVAANVVSRSLNRSSVRDSIRSLVLRLVSIAVWTVGILIAALIVFPGLTPAKALGGMGLLSVAIGFAFRDIFENFFAGILLLWRFPFEQGDFIQCQGIMGKVEQITIRMSKIRKTSGELVVVPNSFLFKNPVEILTETSMRRVTILAGVAYDADVSEAIGVIKSAVASCNTVSAEKSPEVFAQNFAASSVDIEVSWWTAPTPMNVRESTSEVLQSVKLALEKAGIEIPFPQRTLALKEPLQGFVTQVHKPSGDSE